MRNRTVTTVILGVLGSLPALANITTYTSSSAYDSATAGYSIFVDEQYASGFTDGEDISSGTTIDGITYSNFSGFTNADITNQYNSFSGLSLGADHTDNGASQTYFYGTDSLEITFATPVNAAGVFFNVNLDSGGFGFSVPSLSASSFTGSAAYDVGSGNTFVFAGITSTTPFTTLDISATSPGGSYNIPEITAAVTPEPAYFVVLGIGLGALMLLRRLRSA